MKVCVDVGNTTVKIGLFEDDVLLRTISFMTETKKTEDQFIEIILTHLRLYGIEYDNVTHVVYSSVVPSINIALRRAIYKIFKCDLLTLGPGIKTGVSLKVDNPNEVGNDLIADVVGAKNKYGYPLLIADLGTASKILLVDKDGSFSGCALMPGIYISAECLTNKGELLPAVSLEAPKKVVARNTIDAMNVGIVYGHLDMVLGIMRRFEKELGYECKKILTGGGSIHFKNISDDFIYDKNVTLEGLLHILNKNIGN